MKRKDKRRRRKQRESRDKHQFRIRAGFNDEHHLKPGSRGGETINSNLIVLDVYRHDAWHLLFKNLTLDEIILLLERLRRIKKSQVWKGG